MRAIIKLVETQTQVTVVRNPSFRRWFGASKVVDKANAPLIVYHGSNAHAYVDGQIDVFHTGGERGAAFFTSNPGLATEYGEKVYKVYLRIVNPLVVHGDGKHWEALGPDTRISGQVTDPLRKHHQKEADDLSQLLADPDLFPDDEPVPVKSAIPNDAISLETFKLRVISGDEVKSTDQIVKHARRFGYDGVIFHDVRDSPTADSSLYRHQLSDIYAVFSSRQVKSATDNNGTFSPDDGDIRG